MGSTKLRVARIGNSRGVRLPAASLRRYRIGETVLMEERSEGILLRQTGPAVEKLSWEDTAREMAASREDWSVWDVWQPPTGWPTCPGRSTGRGESQRPRPATEPDRARAGGDETLRDSLDSSRPDPGR